MSLPSGYKYIEYIKSNTQNYINTNFYPKYNSRVVMDISDVPNDANYLFGTRSRSSGSAEYQFGCNRATATTVRIDYFGGNTSGTVSDSSPRTIIDMNSNKLTAWGVTVTRTAATSGECPYPLFLLNLNNAGSAGGTSTAAEAKVYSCQIYDNGTIVRDYIPCLNLAGEAGLYDQIYGVFYGDAAGVGFEAGPEIIVNVDTPTNFEQILAVYLRWSAVDCDGYKIYRNGTLVGTTANNFFVDLTANENEQYTYTLTAYRGNTESDPATLEVYTRSGYFVLKPVIESAFFQ